MNIIGVASALPPHYYPQSELIEIFRQYWGPKVDRFDILERLHAATRVDGRYLVLPKERYPKLQFGDANDVWIESAVELGEQAICRAIEGSGISPKDIGAFIFVSITGVCSPSVDARLINRMRLHPYIKRMPIFGLGCVAGAAGLARAADYVKAYPDQAAVLLSVEFCSLTIQQDDLSIANLISSGLFGDGAAAAIVAGSELATGLPGPRIVATRSVFYPETEHVMGWDISEKGFRIVLSREVPDVVLKNLGKNVDMFLAEHGLSRVDLSSWIIHTGGPKVLEATQAALDLPDHALDISWQCLARTGNLSSASVLFVLEETLKSRPPEPGSWGLLSAMGPGFCAELLLLRW